MKKVRIADKSLYVMPIGRSVDIDSEIDFKLAQVIMEAG